MGVRTSGQSAAAALAPLRSALDANVDLNGGSSAVVVTLVVPAERALVGGRLRATFSGSSVNDQEMTWRLGAGGAPGDHVVGAGSTGSMVGACELVMRADALVGGAWSISSGQTMRDAAFTVEATPETELTITLTLVDGDAPGFDPVSTAHSATLEWIDP